MSSNKKGLDRQIPKPYLPKTLTRITHETEKEYLPLIETYQTKRITVGQKMQESEQCKALLYAILERAVLDYKGKHESKYWLTAHYARDAKRWLFAWRAKDLEKPFTFPWICINLDLDPYSTQSKIKKLVDSAEDLKACGLGYVRVMSLLSDRPYLELYQEHYSIAS